MLASGIQMPDDAGWALAVMDVTCATTARG